MLGLTLKAEARTETGKGISRRLRASGRIPAVMYGKGQSPRAISVAPRDITKILASSRGRNTPIDLKIDGEKGTHLTIIKDYQVHPWKRSLRHVDFWQIGAETVIELEVPLTREGKAELELVGGRCQVVKKTLTVRCKPKDIPESISFDMTKLAENSVLMAWQLTLPEGVELSSATDFKVLHVKMPKIEVELEEIEGEEEEAEGEEAAEESAED